VGGESASELARAQTLAEQVDASGSLRNELMRELAHHQESRALPAGQQRQAQPPSLLQLTTTNNHINSLLQCSPGLEMGQLGAQTVLSSLAGSQTVNEGQLTISTPAAVLGGGAAGLEAGQQLASSSAAALSQQLQQRSAELRTSRSAGCLFRANSSGASSPRTVSAIGLHQNNTAPNTPLGPPGDSALNNELPGDPSSLVKLLMQIEQLKTSIAHVSRQLESVVELYKKSIDNIST